jgi:hypothetical protein
MDNLKEDYYVTKDLHFAAFLKLSGIPLARLERRSMEGTTRNPVFFYFQDVSKCNYLETIFWNGQGDELMINVKDYTVAIKDLRSRIASIAMQTMQ